jgi:methionine sulfoxide reductase heme-binding subunit
MNRAAVNRVLLHPAAKPLLWLLCLVPLAGWIWGGFHNSLGANPAETILRGTGSWTLRFLCIVLAVTPLRQWTGLNALARWRRLLGLYVFFYSVLHFLAYAWLDMGFDPAAVVKDLAKRPFALVGFLAFVLLIPLAATSFNRAIKAMGAARWQRLHRLVYAIALLGLLHFFWMRASKHRYDEVLVYAVVIGLLLGMRLWRRMRTEKSTSIAPMVRNTQASRVTGS